MRIAHFAFAMLVGSGIGAAQVAFTPISAKAWAVAPSSGADLKCIGGTPTGSWPPCTAGSKVQIRGSNEHFRMVSPDPLLTGDRTFIFNANFDENGRGHIWGTWQLSLDDAAGEWAGTYTGFVQGWNGTATGNVVGHGISGKVEGMEVRVDFVVDVFPFGIEMDTGYRFDPKRGK